MNASKDDYRQYFAQCIKYVKMNKVLESIDMESSNFYRFMKSEQFNYIMSVERLESIRNALISILNKIT